MYTLPIERLPSMATVASRPSGILAAMRTVEAEALVGASRDEVWQLYDDIRGTPRWVPFVSEILYVSGPDARRHRLPRAHAPRRLPTVEQWEIVEHRRPTRQVHVSYAFGMESGCHHVRGARHRHLGPPGGGAAIAAVGPVRLGRTRRWSSIPAGWGVRAAVSGAKRAFEGDPPRLTSRRSGR